MSTMVSRSRWVARPTSALARPGQELGWRRPVTAASERRPPNGRPVRRLLVALITLALVAFSVHSLSQLGSEPLSVDGRIVLVIFAVATWAWMLTDIDDTYIALAAALGCVLTSVLPAERLYAGLGNATIWLLLGAFVIADGVTRSGLATRMAVLVIARARTPRQLFHLLSASLVVTTYAVPSTSGRAALAVPVFVALARVLGDRRRLVIALALVFPTVILLSAIGSLLGAGAHLITAQILQTATGEGIGFLSWLLLGLPLAVVASHLAAEIVLLMFTVRADRRHSIRLTAEDFKTGQPKEEPIVGPLSTPQKRAGLLIAAVVVLWCSEPLHGVDPAIIAVLGALLAASPGYGMVELSSALKGIPWSLLLFMAATLALGEALVSTGVANWLAIGVLGPVISTDHPYVALTAVVIFSTATHLLVQSRSARSTVLVPIVIALAPAAGLAPAAAAYASTAAAGFCHTLTSSAKPVAMFAKLDDCPTYDRRDLLRLSAVLAPVHVLTVVAFASAIWPALGMPLTP